ncbi:DUF362 domain-containing protein [bacterium]|nr:DUF362 domain-containing protein [bacterium]
MSKVFFKAITLDAGTEKVSAAAKELLGRIIESEGIVLEKEIPMKVHFGEKGNITFIKPECYNGLIDFLEERKIKTSFIETNVLYKSERRLKETHLELAKEHGFTRIPIIIADGNHGENYYEVEVNKKHFKTCKIGKEFSNYNQFLVTAHFKGHMMAGFGGAIKQLAMGFGSRGGKLAMHLGIKPKIKESACTKCGLCKENCPVNAITITEKKSFIDKEKCIGCAACTAVCPKNAIKVFPLNYVFSFIGNSFLEKIAEYAFAAQKGKKNIYINFALNITPRCDCSGDEMKPVAKDIGVFASTDPVAIDQACYDLVKKSGKKLRGQNILKYAEKIGLGSRNYELISVE